MDRGAWQALVCRVAKSWTQLSRWAAATIPKVSPNETERLFALEHLVLLPFLIFAL